MKLNYSIKKSEKDILSRAKSFGKFNEISLEKSLFLFGDNFENLSKLLNTFGPCVDLVYIDPPFNTNQIFSVSGGRNNTISRSNDGEVAYSDLMQRDEYIEFIRERLILIRELLTEKGSIYLHIDNKIGHYIKIIMDEVFGEENFRNDITRVKSNPKNFGRKAYGNEKDVIYFYCKNTRKQIWNEIRVSADEEEIEKLFPKVDADGRRYTTIPLHAPGETKDGITGTEWRGMLPPKGRHWRTNPVVFDELDSLGLIEWSKTGNPRIKKFADEHKGKKIQDIWKFKDPQYPIYPTEKNLDMLIRIVEQSSTEGSIVMDCFAGSGSTLIAAASKNRKWIGMDSSELALKTIEKQSDRLGSFIIIKKTNDQI
jgi:adenine-specific DNA-methyltransferase